MAFQGPLGRLLAGVPGAQGAILADWEGEAVDQAGLLDDYDLKVIGAHKGVILHSLRKVVARLGDDRLREIVITTSCSQMLVLPVTDEYYLVVTLDRSAALGRALFEARRCAHLLQKEIL
jgi:predicted regulator of Ras-like GTPase activity (Roadblock/LC7/MglB family)